MVKKTLSRIYMVLIFLFLYLPIAVLIVLSFNKSESRVNWGGFTLKWYASCFKSESIMSAFATTLEITFLAAILATLIGTLAAIGISAMKKRNQTIYLGATNIPLLNADIVTGISMMLLFVKFVDLGFVTVLIAHITFNIPYVILNVLPKFKQANKATYEAALDLGASPMRAFFTVTWPEIRSGVFSGFLMAVTMSLDDFSITYFTKGAGVNTLSTMLYAQLRKGIKPEMYALSTILFLTVLLLLIAVNLNGDKALPSNAKKEGAKDLKKRRQKNMARRVVSIAIIAVLVIGSGSVLISNSRISAKSSRTLTVLNYGKYIDEGVLKEFEETYGIDVKYEEYEEPEEMYTKYKAGSIDYDVICTSDYIIEKLIKEDELLTIDYDQIPNYQNLDTNVIEASTFDPTHEYTVPYFYGTVGILYDTTKYSEEEVSSWNILWDTDFDGDMIMINSIRDAFTPALITLGYSINDSDPDHMTEALQLLFQQEPQVAAYYVDETCDEMVAGNADLAVCYSGEAACALDENEDLAYVVPEEGSNLWIDSWFVPKTCQNYDDAMLFLNYICGDEEGMTNFDYVYYASPILYVQQNMDVDDRLLGAINPTSEVLSRCEVYSALDDDAAAYENTLWQKLKSN